jgi:hypothetical protein
MALTYEQLQKSIARDRELLRMRKAPPGVSTCHSCKVPLRESVTGNRKMRVGGKTVHLCSDCFFDKWGDEIEKNPIAMPRRSRGG